MNKKNGWLLAAAVLLITGAAADRAWAYFTTYASAAGSIALSLGEETRIEENISDWTKRVTITSEENSGPVYIRARAFSGSEYPLTYSSEGGTWSDGGDGYWYYDSILHGGEQTAGQLLVHIEGIPEDVSPGTDFHVIVVYESTPVLYGEDGEPYADWTAKVDSGTAEPEEPYTEGGGADGR